MTCEHWIFGYGLISNCSIVLSLALAWDSFFALPAQTLWIYLRLWYCCWFRLWYSCWLRLSLGPSFISILPSLLLSFSSCLTVLNFLLSGRFTTGISGPTIPKLLLNIFFYFCFEPLFPINIYLKRIIQTLQFIFSFCWYQNLPHENFYILTACM